MDNSLSLLQSLGCESDSVNTVTGLWLAAFALFWLKYYPGSESTSLTELTTPSQLTSTVTSLAHLASIRSSMIDFYTSHLEKIEESARSLPSAEELNIEASQLHAVLNSKFLKSAQETALTQQINDMCELLEASDTEDGVLRQVLTDAHCDRASLDIQTELERAWSLDQVKILEAKEKLLDAVCDRYGSALAIYCTYNPQTIASYREDLIIPLETLHLSLSSTDERMKNSEALIGSFGVELEELVDEVRIAKENSQLPLPQPAEERADEYLETILLETLKNLKGLFCFLRRFPNTITNMQT